MRFPLIRLGALALMLALSACSPQSLFYFPNRILYHDPATMGLAHEIVEFQSLNGKKLYGVYFRTPHSPKGTVVHFHGNYGNVSNHFPLALFLLDRGYDVFSFDYEGYGASQGRPTPAHLVADGRAAVRYAQSHLRPGAAGVLIFGQSLGGAAAIVVAAEEKEVKGAVVESSFGSYQSMGRDVLSRFWWTWPLYPFAPLLLNRREAPLRYVAEVSPRPLFFIHGNADRVVPVRMSEQLFAHAKEPKSLWIIPGAGHLQCSRVAGKEYTQRIDDFFVAALAGSAIKIQ